MVGVLKQYLGAVIVLSSCVFNRHPAFGAEDCSKTVEVLSSTIREHDLGAVYKARFKVDIVTRNVGDVGLLIWFGVPATVFRYTPVHAFAARVALARRLTLASATGDMAQVRGLLRQGAPINIIPATEDWMPPLIMAAQCGQGRIVSYLLAHGAEPNIGGYSMGTGVAQNSTALRWAAWLGYDNIIKTLLLYGADANSRETPYAPPGTELQPGWTFFHNGTTPLISAVSFGPEHVAGVDLLLAADADFDAEEEDGRTALIWAASRGQTAAVTHLLAAGADAKHADHAGLTALAAAREGGYAQMAQVIADALAKSAPRARD